MLENFTLLYIEDDLDAQERMKMMLEDDVKEFFQAYNGEEGLRVYEEKKPDIILTDINMPVLDGLSMAKEIKQKDKQQPIIVMSAFDDRKTLLEAINIGIDYFTPKPIDMDIVYDRLNTIAEHLQNKIDAQNAKKREMEELYALAHYDTLTKISNRFLFNIKLDEAINKAKRYNSKFTLFFIDLDDFKMINDTYGHAAGDKVLQSVSDNIKKVIRLEDTFARISGDEFSLIIENIDDKNYIDTLANKIIGAASTPVEFNDKTIHITCSVGISRYPKDSNSKEELLHLADIAMYKAKQQGKCNFAYATN